MNHAEKTVIHRLEGISKNHRDGQWEARCICGTIVFDSSKMEAMAWLREHFYEARKAGK